MKPYFFKTGQDYNNVYFLVIDAKEHSKIVKYNDLDKVDFTFDEFEQMVYSSVERKAEASRCQYAGFWGWQGDGGLCIFYDEDESRARETAILSAKEILAEIPHLNGKLNRSNIKEEIHVRIALHKGSVRYKGLLKRGSIHSKELNLVSHVEKVVPSDTLAISKDVYDISGTLKADFSESRGKFENIEFYLYSTRPTYEILEEWQQNLNAIGEKRIIGLETDVPSVELGLAGVFSQRALTAEYVSLIHNARVCVWTLGIGLGGFQSNHKKSIVLEKALKGVDIRLLIADPEVYVKIDKREFSLPSWRDYVVDGGSYNKLSNESLAKMVDAINREIEKNPLPNKAYVKLKYYTSIPTFAMLRVDSILFFSPYFTKQRGLKSFTLKLREGGRLYDQCLRHFRSIWDDSNYSKVTSNVFQG